MPRVPSYSWISLAFAALFALAFWADVRGWLARVEHPAATLVESEGTVRRLPRGKFAWLRIEAGEELGLGDVVATGEESRAQLELKDGTLVELDPGSMITLSENAGGVRLGFLSGAGRFEKPEPAREPAEAASLPEQPRRPRVARRLAPAPKPVIRPLARMTAAPAPVATQLAPLPVAEAPTAAPIQQVRTSEASKPRFALVAPRGGETIAAGVDAQGTVTLAWTAEGSSARGPVEVVIAPLEGQGKARVIRTLKDSIRVGELAPGRYDWHVRVPGKKSSGREPASERRWFEVRAQAKLAKPVVEAASSKRKLAKPEIIQVRKPSLKPQLLPPTSAEGSAP